MVEPLVFLGVALLLGLAAYIWKSVRNVLHGVAYVVLLGFLTYLFLGARWLFIYVLVGIAFLVVWGWWLSTRLRRERAEKEAAQKANELHK